MTDLILNPYELLAANGGMVIGDGQVGIAFTAVASGGTGLLNITAATHKMTKGTQFSIDSGPYQNYYRVKKVISASVIQVEGTFGSTATGTLARKAAMDGYGFFADKGVIAIAELIPFYPSFDVQGFLDTEFILGNYYPCEFKKLKLTTGDVTCIRKPVPATLAYTNR